MCQVGGEKHMPATPSLSPPRCGPLLEWRFSTIRPLLCKEDHHEESTCCWPLPRILVGRYHFCVALNRVVCADGGRVSAVAYPRVTINVVGSVACGGSCAQVRGGRGPGVAAVTDA